MTATLISAQRAILGPADRVLEAAAVLIDNGRILAVGSSTELQAHADPATEHVAIPGATILPGLIDAHVHLAFDSGPDPAATLAQVTDPESLLPAMATRTAAMLTAGVTTARDLGDRGRVSTALRAAIARGDYPGPRLLVATTPLTSPGGHCWFLGGEVATAGEIATLIDENAAAGADLIKVMASGGALTPGGPPMWQAQFDAAQLEHIVRKARQHQLPVAAHAHGTDTIAACVAAGVSTIEHCSWRTAEGLAYDHDLARKIAASRIGVCRCVSGDWRTFLTQLGPNAEPLMATIRRMREAGVRFIAGTDAGVPGARFDDYAGMLEFFINLGFSTAEVIDMATAHAADALGIAATTGRLRPGQRSDVLVVDGNPLDDVRALRNVRLVVAGDRILHTGALGKPRPCTADNADLDWSQP